MAYKDFYDLDYSSIKSRLKIFLKNETDLTDYNFEGSGISNWLNIMSYVISYIGAVLNFVANEMFITTAQKESNILKMAYQLNYLPRRKSAPFINLTFTNSSLTTDVTLPLYTTIQMGEIKLVLLKETIIVKNTSQTVKFYEGEWIINTKISDGSDYETIILDHKETVDWDKFSVQVSYINGNGSDVWKSVYQDINYSNAKNYFIKYLKDFKIQFDKAGGMFDKPSLGDTITIQYLNTHGATYNGYSYSTQLVLTSNIVNDEFLTISLNNQVLQDGLDEENLESISNNAPLFYSASGRAVTEEDYNVKIKSSSLYHNMADMFVYSSHKDYVDRENENPTELLTNESKRDLGYYIFGGFRRNTNVSMNNRYIPMTVAEQQEIKDFFKPFKYMQTFGKFKQSHVWYIKPKLDVKLISDLNVEEDEFKNELNEELEKIVGYDNSFNLSEFIAFVKSFSFVDYCKISYKNVIRIYKPYVRMIIDDYIEDFNVGDSITGSTSGVSGTVVRVDATKEAILVERTSGGAGQFNPTEIINNTTTGVSPTIINFYHSVVVRVGMKIEEQSISSNGGSIGIYDDGSGLIKIGVNTIGTVNYDSGYITFEYDFDDEYIELLIETTNYEKIDARLDMFLDYQPLVNNATYSESGINYI